MRLNRVEIKNFRSISSVTIKFEPRCRILVGINESGKTNILRALSLLDPKRNISPDDIRTFPPEEDPNQKAVVWFVFSLDKDERISIYENVLMNVLVLDSSTPIIMHNGKPLSLAKFVDSKNEGLFVADIRKNTRYSASWAMGEGFSIAEGWKKPTDKCPPNFQVKTENNENLKPHNFKLIHESGATEIPLEYLADADLNDVSILVSDHIKNMVKDNIPDCLYWTYSDSHLLPGQIPLDAFASNPMMCEPLKHMFELAEIDDINAAISAAKAQKNGIRNLLNRVAKRGTEHMRHVWKEYRGISIALEPNGANIDASIKDEHNLYDFSRRSDGFKRFISFLLMVSAKVKTEELVNTLYLHDEPDISLHPSGARYLRDEHIKISDNNYVVFSTHSIFMVDKELLRRHLIVEKKAEITTVREVDESNIVDEEVIYNALGYSIFENLKANNIVFEGWRDKRMFQVAIKNVPAKYRAIKSKFTEIGVCHARGVKDIGRITPILELANRKWVVVSDGDRPALEQQRLYDGSGPWFRYDELLPGDTALTGEDFIKPDAFRVHIERISSELPQLGAFDLAMLSAGEPKLNVLRKWLSTGGMSGDDVKTMLENLKEHIFSNLKATHIEEKYYIMLSNLLGNPAVDSGLTTG